MTVELASSLQILRPYSNILAFYDGRIAGLRMFSPEPNWLDDGAFTLGCCSFAVVEGDEALVYDTHMSIPHARLIRRTLEAQGVTRMRVVLSHWHPDHIAGNAVFADCEIIANTLTAAAMVDNRERLENDTPPIKPVIMPTTTFETEITLRVGGTVVELRHLDIHSHDETVLLLPQSGVLLAGDTLEDTVTYVTQPKRLAIHLQDLARMESWAFTRILPNHGSVAMIEAGGYERNFIVATRLYIQKLLRLAAEPALAELSLADFAADSLASGGVSYFDAYEQVHRHNVEAVLAVR
ncbi:MBL fold metallo-hydrolase [uncultured Devosia sp.]|uniref:MBL fold metallo-hydrolase n=1 Tax=uncultured Devosia sp. TaxID=211434 RepID=UPI0035CB9514